MKGGGTIMHSFGGFTRFVSRPYRDVGLLVVLSRHCEDSVLLYRVMQGLVPVGTNRHYSFVIDSTVSRFYGSRVLVGNGLPALLRRC